MMHTPSCTFEILYKNTSFIIICCIGELFSPIAPVTIQFAEQSVSRSEIDSPMEFEIVLSGAVDRTVLVEVRTNSASADG